MALRRPRPSEDSFAGRVSPEPNTGCWLWTGATNGRYGVVSRGGNGVAPEYAHRLAFERFSGSRIPSGLFVCHRCDQPLCVNPAHLFAGTPADNMADMALKGRGRTLARPGESHPMARLREADVLEIRRMYRAGERLEVISRRFGICAGYAKKVASGRYWKHVPGAVRNPPHLHRSVPQPKL